MNVKNIKADRIVFGVTKAFLIYVIYGIFTYPASLLFTLSDFRNRYVSGFWTDETLCISSFLFSLVFLF